MIQAATSFFLLIGFEKLGEKAEEIAPGVFSDPGSVLRKRGGNVSPQSLERAREEGEVGK